MSRGRVNGPSTTHRSQPVCAQSFDRNPPVRPDGRGLHSMKPSSESKMTERRTTTRRAAPQAQIETRAIEIASAADARLDGHEDLCTERFKNLSEDIKQLSGDAKAAISELSSRQDNNHRTNTDALREVASTLADLSQKVAVGQGKADGANGAGGIILKLAPIIMMAIMLVLTWMKH